MSTEYFARFPEAAARWRQRLDAMNPLESPHTDRAKLVENARTLSSIVEDDVLPFTDRLRLPDDTVRKAWVQYLGYATEQIHRAMTRESDIMDAAPALWMAEELLLNVLAEMESAAKV